MLASYQRNGKETAFFVSRMEKGRWVVVKITEKGFSTAEKSYCLNYKNACTVRGMMINKFHGYTLN